MSPSVKGKGTLLSMGKIKKRKGLDFFDEMHYDIIDLECAPPGGGVEIEVRLCCVRFLEGSIPRSTRI